MFGGYLLCTVLTATCNCQHREWGRILDRFSTWFICDFTRLLKRTPCFMWLWLSSDYLYVWTQRAEVRFWIDFQTVSSTAFDPVIWFHETLAHIVQLRRRVHVLMASPLPVCLNSKSRGRILDRFSTWIIRSLINHLYLLTTQTQEKEKLSSAILTSITKIIPFILAHQAFNFNGSECVSKRNEIFAWQ